MRSSLSLITCSIARLVRLPEGGPISSSIGVLNILSRIRGAGFLGFPVVPLSHRQKVMGARATSLNLRSRVSRYSSSALRRYSSWKPSYVHPRSSIMVFSSVSATVAPSRPILQLGFARHF
jgi:hypothetical protein